MIIICNPFKLTGTTKSTKHFKLISLKIFHFYLGSENLAKQLQDVFEYYLTKQTNQSSFVFTKKLHPESGKLLCAAYGFQSCQMENIRALLQSHLTNLPQTADDWLTRKNRHRRMGLMTWLVMHNVQTSDKQLQQASDEILAPLYELVKENDVAGIEEFLNYVPAFHYYDFWVKDVIDAQQCVGQPGIFIRRCVFLDMFNSVKNFATFLRRKSKSKYILTRSDWRKAMEVAKLSKIKDQITQQSLEIKKNLQGFSDELKNFMGKELGGRFNALGKQMQTMADFDRRKSQADINFVTGRLDYFRKTINEYLPRAGKKIEYVLRSAMVSAGYKLAQKVAQLAVETLKMSNPIAVISGGADPNAIADRADEVASAGVDIAKAKKLMDYFKKAMRKVVQLSKAAAANRDQQTVVKRLTAIIAAKYSKTTGEVDENELNRLTDIFLKLYDGYDPQLKKSDITELGSLLELVMDEGCDLLFGDVTTASALAAGMVASSGECLDGKSDIQKLIELYGQMYDFQFDLMDSLAEVVRGNVAYASAAALTVPFTKLENKLSEAINFQVMSVKMLIVYRIHNMQLVSQFCDYMEYLSGGEEPVQCKIAREKLTDDTIDKLIPLNPMTCSKVRNKWVRIPTKPSHKNDTAFIDLNAIYTGRQVPFHIPDAKWLVDHFWINRADVNNFVYYLQDLQIILPDVVDNYREVRTTVSAVNAVKLVPNQKAPQYILAGNDVTKIRYAYSDMADLCSENKKISLYDYCRDENKAQNKDTDICEVSKTTQKTVSPSVFSNFVIKSTFEGQGKNINFTTPMHVLAKIQLCIMCKGGKCQPGFKRDEIDGIEGDNNGSSNVAGSIRSLGTCCVKDKKKQYYDLKKRSCQACPAGSEPVKTGHYCAISAETKGANGLIQ